MESIWREGSLPRRAGDAMHGSLSTDVVIVGAGITGLMTALRLHDSGVRVVVVEAGEAGASNTGRSTGNLYATTSRGLRHVRKKWGDDVLRRIVQLRAEGVRRIEALAASMPGAAGFMRVPQLIGVAHDEKQAGEIDEEREACVAAGLDVTAARDFAIPLRNAFEVARQAQFNPMLFAQALAVQLRAAGVPIFEHVRATDADASEGRLGTSAGEIRARHLVFATHTPQGFNLVQAEMEPYLEYGVASPDARLPEAGIHWIHDLGRSIRTHEADGRRWLVVVGEKHKTGEHEPGVDYCERLADTARTHFGAQTFTHRWSAQQYRPADELPYIGRSAHDNVLIATGFGADGLTWGAVAAELLGQLVLDREDADTKLLTPRRFTPVKSGKLWGTENAAVVEHMTVDYLRGADDALDAIAPGEGSIARIDGHQRAVYRGTDGEVVVLSCVCPHLKCKVAWNGVSKTWDCPCHGSRFAPSGEVLEGPAWTGLERI